MISSGEEANATGLTSWIWTERMSFRKRTQTSPQRWAMAVISASCAAPIAPNSTWTNVAVTSGPRRSLGWAGTRQLREDAGGTAETRSRCPRHRTARARDRVDDRTRRTEGGAWCIERGPDRACRRSIQESHGTLHALLVVRNEQEVLPA